MGENVDSRNLLKRILEVSADCPVRYSPLGSVILFLFASPTGRFRPARDCNVSQEQEPHDVHVLHPEFGERAGRVQGGGRVRVRVQHGEWRGRRDERPNGSDSHVPAHAGSSHERRLHPGNGERHGAQDEDVHEEVCLEVGGAQRE